MELFTCNEISERIGPKRSASKKRVADFDSSDESESSAYSPSISPRPISTDYNRTFEQLPPTYANLSSAKMEEFVKAIKENTEATKKLTQTNNKILRELTAFRKTTEDRLNKLETFNLASSTNSPSVAPPVEIPIPQIPVSEVDLENIKEQLPLKNLIEIQAFEEFLKMSNKHVAAFKSFMDTIEPEEDQHHRFRSLLTAIFYRDSIFQEYSWHGQSSSKKRTKHCLKSTLPAQYVVDYIKSLGQINSAADYETFRKKKNRWGTTWVDSSRDMYKRVERQTQRCKRKQASTKSEPSCKSLKEDVSGTSDQEIEPSSPLQIFIKSEF